VVVAVVTHLDAVLDDAVAAHGRCASVGAGIGVERVAVVALLHAHVDDAVAAHGRHARVCAVVGVVRVAVVALLVVLDDPVAAGWTAVAVAIAGVAITVT